MVWLVLLAVFIWLILFLRKKLSFSFGLAPEVLETKPIKGLKKVSDHLEQSLSKSFIENVEERVRKENKLKENEYEWRLVELKRYFILTALLKEAPMFSEKVDELWHQMLMFTREYDDFSKKYLGKTLHHRPNMNADPNPDGRGFFDWVYAELFFVRKESIYLYNGFFNHPVNPKIISEFKNLREKDLIDRYFNGDIKYTPTVISLISSMKKTAIKAKNYEKNVVRDMLRKSKMHQKYNAMLLPFISVSYFHYDDFASYMKISGDSIASYTSCGSGSSCNSSSCTSDSSCSSCGGGSD